MASFEQTVFGMVAAHELSAAQAAALISSARQAASVPVSKPTAAPGWPIAVIGMSGRFPGARSTDELWGNLRDGRSAIGRWPRDRQAGIPDEVPAWGGFLDGIKEFDPRFFGISPKEAEVMDPQQSLFLEEAWKALEDAGYGDRSLDGARCGVFAGVGSGDYGYVLDAAGVPPDGHSFMGTANAILAGRISYLLNLKGPCLAVDTACSSSLTAITLACESLAQGACDMAIAGGLCVLNTTSFLIAATRAGMLSPSGRCRAFDREADGFVPGEAAAVIVLKPLERALLDGDHIHGVIEGAAINQDGRTNGITAPSAPSQTALELEVYSRFGIDPRCIGFVEAHGTGTRLGDPIEIEALTKAFRRHTADRQFCAVGSVKTALGHTMSAAGVVSVIKVLLSLRHGQLPPSLNYVHENEAIGFSETPFFVNDRLRDWAGPRRAAVSGFGFGGTNVHMVIAEPPPRRASTARPPYLIPLSGRSAAALARRVEGLEDWLRRAGPGCDLGAVACTLGLGRSHFEHRAALVADGFDDLLGKLARMRAGATAMEAVGDGAGADLARRYAGGGDIDWAALYPDQTRRRVSLPTYPFERQDCRLHPALRPRRLFGLHPLLDRAAGSGGGLFVTRFSADMPVLRDHVVGGRAILPGACWLEMACAALSESGRIEDAFGIGTITFAAPFEVGDQPRDAVMGIRDDGGRILFEGRSGEGSGPLHVSGGLLPGPVAEAAPLRLDLDAVHRRCPSELDGDGLYRKFAGAGVACGPLYRTVRRLRLGEDEAVAELAVSPDETRYRLHPLLLDGAFQAAMAWMARHGAEGTVLVPFSIGSVEVLGPLPATCTAYVKIPPGGRSGEIRCNIALLDETGKVLVRVLDFHARRLMGDTSRPPSSSRVAEPVPCYRPVWIERPLAVAATGVPDEGVLLVLRGAGDAAAGDRVAAGAGNRPVLQAVLAAESRPLAPGTVAIDRTDQAEYDRLLAGLKPVGTILFLASSAPDAAMVPASVPEAEEAVLLPLFRLLKALRRRPQPDRPVRLVLVTSGVRAAALAGLAMTAAHEWPFLRLVLVEDEGAGGEGADLLSLAAEETGEDAPLGLAYRDGRRHVRTLEPVALPALPPARPVFRRGGVYVLVGGAGGLGLALARHLAERYGARLLLIGRGPLGASQRRELDGIGATAEVRYARADVTDAAAMAACLDEARGRWGAIHGVFHAAMLLQDCLLDSMSEATFRAALAPKMLGSTVLADLLRDEPLDFLVFFSSANSQIGNPGQANYAAASTFQDAFARRLAAQGMPARVINWGYWGEVGAVATPAYLERAAGVGIGALSSAEGMAVLERFLASDLPQVMAMKVSPETLACHGIAVAPPSVPAPEVAPMKADNTPPSSPAGPAAGGAVSGVIRRHVALALGLAEDEIDPRRPFAQYGVDSIVGIALVERINRDFGVSLRATALFEFGSIVELAAHLAAEYGDWLADRTDDTSEAVALTTDPFAAAAGRMPDGRIQAEPSNPLEPTARSDDDIAVVGLSCRFPGAADAGQFWENLRNGVCSVAEVPPERWDVKAYWDPEPGKPGKSPCKWAGLLDGIDRFDPLFFQMSGAEAEHTDPQQRLFLEQAWAALEDAGCSDRWLDRRRCGVFVGATAGDYQAGRGADGMPEPYAFLGNAQSILAGRLAYLLNLRGPALAVDTACSSALAAVHLACRSLQAGECEAALAGGVFVTTTSAFHYFAGTLGMLSPTGTCSAFDDRADGFVHAEGVGAVVLRRLADALADGDTIHGVIRASGMNQDGRTNGITAPNMAAQAELLTGIYQRAGIDPATIGYVEAHGTGTRLGDPIEVEALTRAFRHGKGPSRDTDANNRCLLGSVKTNIGHTGPAAGMAGLIKVLLCLRHGELAPSLNFAQANRHIDFAGSPFDVARDLRPWPARAGVPRRAAVSAFGLSGTNVHVVVEEAPAVPRPAPASRSPQVFCLSARTATALRRRMEELARWVEGAGRVFEPADIAFTLNAGRSHFDHRAALVADGHDGLAAALAGNRPADLVTGRAAPTREPVTIGAADLPADPHELAGLFVRGADIDWPGLYAGQGRRRLSMPTYPFDRDRYWNGRTPDAHAPDSLPPAGPDAAPSQAPLCCFRPSWRAEPAIASGRLAGRIILMVGDDGTLAAALERQAGPLGAAVRRCAAPADGRDYELPVPPGGTPADLILAGLPAGGASPLAALHPLFKVASALLRAGLADDARLLIGHDGADGPDGFAAQAADAFGPSLRNAGLASDWTVVARPGGMDTDAWARLLLAELDAPFLRPRPGVRYREGRREVRGWERFEAAPSASPLRRGGVYWITGGCGALGGRLARHLVERWRAKVVVSGRHPPVTPVEGTEFIALDVTDIDAVRRAADGIRRRHGRLDGVIHAAGTIHREPLSARRLEDVDAVLSPKLLGALTLDEATADLPLDFFALYSSLAAAVGDFGQCDYAVANRWLDLFAQWRAGQVRQGRRRGATAGIGWGLWAEGGMTLAPDGQRAHTDATGLVPLPTELGLAAFEACLASGLPNLLVTAGDAERIGASLGIGAEVPRQADAAAESGPTVNGEAVTAAIRAAAAELLKLPPASLDAQTPLSDFGLDSLNMKRLADHLSGLFGVALQPTVFFRHNSIAALAGQLCLEFPGIAGPAPVEQSLPSPPAPAPVPDAAAPSAIPPAARPAPAAGREPIAIIGMAGRFPQSPDLESFWANLEAERDLITEIPAERWDWRRYASEDMAEHARSASRWGGFMPDLDKFDAGFFGISPREAIFMDPQHRVFLESVWNAIEDGGIRASSLAGRRVGLFVGCQFNEYMGLIGDAGPAKPQAVLGNTHTMLANRVSFHLDLRGPSEAIDTACSSSLVAVHRAVRSLQTGDCELAIAGGVSAILSAETYVLSSQIGMLSHEGRCKTFDSSADGYVKGEGVGAVLLKPLSRALADGDPIHALIRAGAENHGGRATSLTAPNPDAQAALIAEAWEAAGVDPASVTYVEAHGTGTELGDPIELDALRRAMRGLAARSARPLPAGAFCGIGSVKSNIGHLEPASGIAGLLKTVLALGRRRLPATLHVREANPYLELGDGPFRLVTRTEDWPAPVDGDGTPLPRRAAVSSFGFGGSNAHLVLEEAPPRGAPPSAGAVGLPLLVPLSARTASALRDRVAGLLAFLDAARRDWDDAGFWAGLVRTLQDGREAMARRLAVVARSPSDLYDRLSGWLEAGGPVEGVFLGTAGPGRAGNSIFETREELNEVVRNAVAKGRFGTLARLWIEGAELDWPPAGPGPIRRLALPGYPFARERHWFDDAVPKQAVPKQAEARQTMPGQAVPVPRGPERSPPAIRIVEPPPAPVLSPSPDALPVEEVIERLRRMLADALYLDPAQIDDDAGFSELGLDSILAVELAKRVQDAFGIDLRATRLYDHANLRDLARFVAGRPDAPQPAVPARRDIDPDVFGAVRRRLRGLLAGVLLLDEAQIDGDLDLVELGLDAVTAAETAQRIRDAFGVSLNPMDLLRCGGIDELAERVAPRRPADGARPVHPPADETVAAGPPPPLPKPSPIAARAANRDSGTAAAAVAIALASPVEQPPEPVAAARPVMAPVVSVRPADIAIVGMAGRFPGAGDLDQFWRNLDEGRDSVTEVPSDRWAIDAVYDPDPGAPAKTYCRRGGFLEGIDLFDPLFFNIPPSEADLMDPQQRLFLEEAWHAIEDAVYADTTLAGRKCAVFVGASQGDYSQRGAGGAGAVSAQFGMGNVNSILAARLAYLLNLKGPAVAIDTACSSSLVAVHLACQSLRAGECDMALAGGVAVMTTPQMHVVTSQARMLAPDGRCKTFDAAADGFVPAEGVGVVVLKRLGDAQRDGDLIRAVIRGSGINQDGRTTGMTAPSVQAQSALQIEVYERYGIDPARIGYVEAHGTGTRLGDPIELEALTASFAGAGRNACAIGSVKTNIGHAVPAAGIAGLIKTVLALEHARIPPSLHFSEPNGHIDFAGSPFYVATEPRAWHPPEGRPRLAAINSFGFSGTNAHVVVEQAMPAPARVRAAATAWLFPLSAKTGEALRRRAEDLIGWLERAGADPALADLSHTLCTGTSHFRQRAAVIAGSRAELLDGLRSIGRDGADAPLQAGGGHPAALRRLAEAYRSGERIAWDEALPVGGAGRIRLPGYPFARRRCWIEEAPSATTTAAETTAAAADAALIDECVAGLVEARATKRLTPASPPVAGHVVGGRSILPGMAGLAMVEAAVQRLDPHHAVGGFRDVVWLRPLEVGPAGAVCTLTVRPGGETPGFEIACDGDLHARGRVSLATPAQRPEPVDLDGLRARCPARLDAAVLYDRFRALGVEYGPPYRRLRGVAAGTGELLCDIEPGAGMAATLDAALQALLGLADGAAETMMLPFALDRLDLFGALSGVCHAHVRGASDGPDGAVSFAASLCDGTGAVLASIQGYRARPIARPDEAPDVDGLILLRPVWRGGPLDEGDGRGGGEAGTGRAAGRALIVARRPGGRLAAALARRHDGNATEVSPQKAPALLETVGSAVSRVYYLAGFDDAAPPTAASADAALEGGLLPLHRLVRSLGARGGKPPGLAIVTCGAFAIGPDEAGNPHAAAIAGFAKVVGREMPDMPVACIDVGSADEADGDARDLDRFAAVIAATGRTSALTDVALRGRRRFERRLEPVELAVSGDPLPGPLPLRRRGVYLIVGGAGGLGLATARRLAGRMQARIALVGRSPLDEARRKALAEIEALGGEALYCQADCTDADAMQAVRRQVAGRWGAINGAIHSALVLADGTVLRTPEASLKAVLGPKIKGSLVLAETLADEPLDWLAFFSSFNSFSANAGQAGYVAGCLFQDASALTLERAMPGKVRILNWGIWGEVGAVAAARYRQRATAEGITPILPEEGVDAFLRVLSADLPQLCPLKLSPARRAEAGFDAAPRWHHAMGPAPAALPAAAPEPHRAVIPELESQGRALLALDRHGRSRLRAILAGLGIADPQVVPSHPGIHPARRRLLAALVTMAGRPEAEAEEGAVAGALPEDPADPMHPMLRMLDKCLDHLPDLLTGRMTEAELLFGGASPDPAQDLVGAAYRQGPASVYNDIAAERVAALAARHGRGGRVRLIELGAGTGATTGPVLAALGDAVDYVYTDLSPRFVNHGRSEFGRRHPSMSFRTLDIERDPVAQGFEAGSFDLVLAANVLHATRDIERTLDHVKRLLRAGGTLVLSETVTPHDVLTLTFGLTEGWWRFEDAERRLPDAPLLDYRGWRQALHEGGFTGIEGFGPVREGGVPTGHAVIVAHSDGWTRRAPEAGKGLAAATPAAAPSTAPSAVEGSGPGGDARAYLRSVLCEVLRIDPGDLDDDLEFDAYGVDSLVAIDLLSRMERDLGSLPKTLFLEHGTVSRLAVTLGTIAALPPAHTGSPTPAGPGPAGPGPAGPEPAGPEPAGPAAVSLLMPIRAGGTRPASFWVPSVLGEIGWTFRMAHHLGADWPVHAFRARRSDGGLPASLEALASRYADAILDAHPAGPYVVGGYSLGGCIAFEIVRRLVAAGAEVERLVLLDSYAPASNTLRSLLAVPFGDVVLPNMVNLMAQQWNGTAPLDPKALPAGDAAARLTAAAEHLLAVCRPPYGRDELASLIGENLEVMQALTALTAQYRPAPLDTPVRTILFRCGDGFAGPASAFDLEGAEIGAPEPDHGWGRLLCRLEVEPVATDHFGLVQEPAIAEVARRLAASGADRNEGERTARQRIFETVRSHVLAVLGDLPPGAVTLETRLRDVGASSIDRVEVATLAMEELNAEVPRTRLAAVDSLGSLVDALYEHGGGR